MLPIDYADYNGDLEYVTYINVTFKEDWGPFKKGEKLSSLNLDFLNNVVSIRYDELHKIKVKLVPSGD